MSRFTPRGARWDSTRDAILERDGHQCVLCGSHDQLEVDHIVALSTIQDQDERERMAYEDSNLRTLCKPCNGRKGARPSTRSTWFNRRWLDSV